MSAPRNRIVAPATKSAAPALAPPTGVEARKFYGEMLDAILSDLSKDDPNDFYIYTTDGLGPINPADTQPPAEPNDTSPKPRKNRRVHYCDKEKTDGITPRKALQHVKACTDHLETSYRFTHSPYTVHASDVQHLVDLRNAVTDARRCFQAALRDGPNLNEGFFHRCVFTPPDDCHSIGDKPRRWHRSPAKVLKAVLNMDGEEYGRVHAQRLQEARNLIIRLDRAEEKLETIIDYAVKHIDPLWGPLAKPYHAYAPQKVTAGIYIPSEMLEAIEEKLPVERLPLDPIDDRWVQGRNLGDYRELLAYKRQALLLAGLSKAAGPAPCYIETAAISDLQELQALTQRYRCDNRLLHDDYYDRTGRWADVHGLAKDAMAHIQRQRHKLGLSHGDHTDRVYYDMFNAANYPLAETIRAEYGDALGIKTGRPR